VTENRSPVDIRRRRITSDRVKERVEFIRSWQRGFEAADGIDLRKRLTKRQRQRIHRAYNKLREITPGADSQQRWIVKGVRSERSSKLYQEYARLPVRIKGLKRVPITSTPWKAVTGPAIPTFSIDYRARKGRGEVRQQIGKARVRVIEFDKMRLLAGDAEYLDELARQFPYGGIGTLVMGGLEQVFMPWASDAEAFINNIMEVMSKYAPVEEDAHDILAGKMRPEDAWDYIDERDVRGSPWPQWLEGARIYFRPDMPREKEKAPTKKNKRKSMSRRQRIKGR